VYAGVTQLAECEFSKLNVAGSTPVARSEVRLNQFQKRLKRIQGQPVVPDDEPFAVEVTDDGSYVFNYTFEAPSIGLKVGFNKTSAPSAEKLAESEVAEYNGPVS
jgi:hypothetical protein